MNDISSNPEDENKVRRCLPLLNMNFDGFNEECM